MAKQILDIVDEAGEKFHQIAWAVGPQNLYLAKLPSHPRLWASCQTGQVELQVFPAIEFVWTDHGWERGQGLWNGSRKISNVESDGSVRLGTILQKPYPGRKAG
jgi:hypothetical protein